MPPVIFGVEYADPVTGLVGVATSRTERFGGSSQACLEWRAADGTIRESWFQEARLVEAHAPNPGCFI